MENFIVSVSHMRDAQKAFFRNKTNNNLQNAIAWEMTVDNMLKDIKKSIITAPVKKEDKLS